MSAFLATGLFVDGFAGGGGASTGIAQAIGRDVDIAINHSPSAIAIHKANHPGTEHYCQDIRIVWPTAATRMRPVAGAWFSPDCKEHSKAKGGPVKDRNIRQLPWEILPWLKETKPTVVYVENVEEMQMWGPLDDDGHVIRDLRGTEFKRWIAAIKRLGYRVEHRELRACDYGTPTSRKRLYIVMRCDGLPIVWPEPTHGAPGSPGVRSGRLLPYRTAAECIDWTIPCPSIFDRKRALKDATHRRIAHGVMRYVVNAAKPFIVPVTHQGSVRLHDIDDPFRTVTGAHRGELALADVQLAPHVTKFHGTGVGAPMDGPMPTVTANGNPARPAGATPLGMVEATLAPFVSYGQHGGANRAIDDPHHTIAASAKDTNGIVAAAIAPLQNGERRPGEKPREQALDHPFSTVATGGKFAAIGATLVGVGGRRGQSPPMPVDGTYPTTTTKADAAVATAELAYLDRQFGNSIGAPIDQPAPATTAGGGGKSAQVTAFLSSFYSSNTNGGRGKPDLPLKTAMAGGQHHAIVTAHIEQANGGPRNTDNPGRDARRPLSTATTTGSQQRIVETTLIEEGALPPELMERAVMVAAFLCKYYATGGENEAGQSQPVDRPLDTVTTRARFAVVTVTIDATTYVIVDIGLRMLKPRELARAQGCPEHYVLDPIVPKIKHGKLVHEPLTIAEQISAIGNMVCPPMSYALVAANQPGLHEERIAA